MRAGSDQNASLSPQYAFVVQYTTDTQIDAGQMRSRMEHVVTRHAPHYESLAALLTFMARGHLTL